MTKSQWPMAATHWSLRSGHWSFAGERAARGGLELFSPLRAVLAQRENLDARLGDHHRVLELGRQPPVVGADGPAVALAEHGLLAAGVDHRLDCEADAGLHADAARLGRGIVGHGRRLMELPAHSVADVFLDDAEVVLGGAADDRIADVAHPRAGAADVDGGPHGVMSTLHDAAGQVTRHAGNERL